MLKRAFDEGLVHVELDRAEIGKNVAVAVGIVGDARTVTQRLWRYSTFRFSSETATCDASADSMPSSSSVK